MMPSNREDDRVNTEQAHAQNGHTKRFKFKRTKRHRHEEDMAHESQHKSRHHHHHHSRKRRKVTPSIPDNVSAWDDSVHDLPSDAAFRESLFDALGDDEGAAYWQNVYGQPIHDYSNTYQNEETGELERMDDEEYATFVRRKMWEKSWEGIEAARDEQRRARAEERQRVKDTKPSQRRRMSSPPDPQYLFDLEVEQSLNRGRQRKDKKRWRALWEDYQRQWNELHGLYEAWRKNPLASEKNFLRNKIAWPVESGKRKDVSHDEVGRFLKSCAISLDNDDDADRESCLMTLVKAERVRFHPDKIQQRYSFMDIDESTLQGVTAVFQALDQLWHDMRQKLGR